MKKVIFCIMAMIMMTGSGIVAYAYDEIPTTHTSKCAVLYDVSSGECLYESGANEQRAIASLVKLMTIYIVMNELETGNIALDDMVYVSERSESMGGSQVFLSAGDEYPLSALLKSVIIASANDSTVALAEHISGSEQSFVSLMNAKAAEIGMDNTNYVNTNGLPAPMGYSTATDIARLLSRLSQYELYREYSQIWMEDIQHSGDRVTTMANTNKLIRNYDGIQCGKTGSTAEAGYCLAVSAERNGLELVAVVLAADSNADRFGLVRDMLDYGYAEYQSYSVIDVDSFATPNTTLRYTDRVVYCVPENDYSITLRRDDDADITYECNLYDELSSVSVGDEVGSITIYRDGEMIENVALLSTVDALSATYFETVKYLLTI